MVGGSLSLSGIYVDTGDLNLRPQAFVTSALPIEQSPQAPKLPVLMKPILPTVEGTRSLYAQMNTRETRDAMHTGFPLRWKGCLSVFLTEDWEWMLLIAW